MRFYGPCSSKDTINTALFCTMYLKLDLCSSALQSSPVALNSTLRPQGITCVYYSSTIRVHIVLNISRREVRYQLSLSCLLLGRTSVSLWVLPIQVALKIGLLVKQCSHVLNKRSSFSPRPLLPRKDLVASCNHYVEPTSHRPCCYPHLL